MEENHVYAGTPAKDVTDKVGPQFSERPYAEKLARFEALCEEFATETGIGPGRFRAEVVEDLGGCHSSENETVFNLRERKYLPARSEGEYRFMKFLLYDKAKFVPGGVPALQGRGGGLGHDPKPSADFGHVPRRTPSATQEHR
jgi:hypothetical protein